MTRFFCLMKYGSETRGYQGKSGELGKRVAQTGKVLYNFS